MEDTLYVGHANKKPIVHIDMDGVIADFRRANEENGRDKHFYSPPEMYKPKFFQNLHPVEPSLDAVRAILRSDKYDVYILTQPLANSPISYTEKVVWICKWFPELKDSIIMTQDKSLIKGDYLIDDNPKWKSFEGEFLFLDPDRDFRESWDEILVKLGI
jgi:5'(3')-deoxyribonucleotidase